MTAPPQEKGGFAQLGAAEDDDNGGGGGGSPHFLALEKRVATLPITVRQRPAPDISTPEMQRLIITTSTSQVLARLAEFIDMARCTSAHNEVRAFW